MKKKNNDNNDTIHGGGSSNADIVNRKATASDRSQALHYRHLGSCARGEIDAQW